MEGIYGKKGIRTSLEFESSREDVHEKLHHAVRRAEHFVEQYETNNDRLFPVEAKSLVQTPVVDEHAE